MNSLGRFSRAPVPKHIDLQLASDLKILATRDDPVADRALLSMLDGGFTSSMRMLQSTLEGENDTALPKDAQRLVDESMDRTIGVDWERIERGAIAYLSLGFRPLMTALGLGSLLNTYASGAFNLQLTLAGDLVRMAPKRLQETGGWLGACLTRDGLYPGNMGFATTIHVRLTHAKMRHAFRSSKKWSESYWGEPISQLEHLHGVLVFSFVAIRSLERVGLVLPAGALSDVYYLWRLIGRLLGVSAIDLVQDHETAAKLLRTIEHLNGPADTGKARPLTMALMGVYDEEAQKAPAGFLHKTQRDLFKALPYRFLGKAQAGSIGVPKPNRLFTPALLKIMELNNRATSNSNMAGRAKSSRSEFEAYLAEHFSKETPTHRKLSSDQQQTDRQ